MERKNGIGFKLTDEEMKKIVDAAYKLSVRDKVLYNKTDIYKAMLILFFGTVENNIDKIKMPEK